MSVASVGSVLAPPMAPNDMHIQAAGQHGTTPDLKAARTETSDSRKSGGKPQVHSAASDLERISLVFDKKLQFVVDQHSNEVTVKVIDKETDKVIKELPPEELQRLHSNLKETIGFLFDERV